MSSRYALVFRLGAPSKVAAAFSPALVAQARESAVIVVERGFDSAGYFAQLRKFKKEDLAPEVERGLVSAAVAFVTSRPDSAARLFDDGRGMALVDGLFTNVPAAEIESVLVARGLIVVPADDFLETPEVRALLRHDGIESSTPSLTPSSELAAERKRFRAAFKEARTDGAEWEGDVDPSSVDVRRLLVLGREAGGHISYVLDASAKDASPVLWFDPEGPTLRRRWQSLADYLGWAICDLHRDQQAEEPPTMKRLFHVNFE